jgi:Zn finger protein HypA/HybF involved in hydrogenase expression
MKIQALYLKCKNCRKMFTQTTYKNKKSTPICPHCKTVNYESTSSLRNEEAQNGA